MVTFKMPKTHILKYSGVLFAVLDREMCSRYKNGMGRHGVMVWCIV